MTLIKSISGIRLVSHFISVYSCEGIGVNVNTWSLFSVLKEPQKSFLN